MNALALGDTMEPSDVQRWTMSAAFAAVLHAALIVYVLFWYEQSDIAGTESSPMMIDLQTVLPQLESRKLDVAPGPVMQEAPPPQAQPTEQQPVMKTEIPPVPVQQHEAVFAPLERKENPKQVKEKQKQPVEKSQQMSNVPAPRTSAPSPAAQAARANYAGLLAAHLQRFKQYPSSSRAAGEQGVAMLNFTVTRNGQVSSSRLTRSSGFSALDAETAAMIRRAQPLPPFPPEMTQSSLNVTVPIRFAIR